MCTRFNGSEDLVVVVENGKYNEEHGRIERAGDTDGLYTIHLGHLQVHEMTYGIFRAEVLSAVPGNRCRSRQRGIDPCR